jgi:hypothetical protein
VVEHGLSLIFTILAERLANIRVFVAEHCCGNQRSVDGSGPAYRERGDGDSGGHLND